MVESSITSPASDPATVFGSSGDSAAPVTQARGMSIPGIGEDGKHQPTYGEKKFDFWVYNGIGYIVNAASSVVAVWAVERTHGGRKQIDKFVNWVGKHTKFNPETIENLTIKTFFLSGGFAVLLPMKLLEDAKVGLVKKWNRQHYGDKADTDPNIQQSEREIELAPKQTWLSVGVSRVLALIPFYLGYGLIWGRKDWLGKISNPEMRHMSADAMKAMETSDPAGFSKITAKGFYIDRPIAWLSRRVGKLTAHVTGDKEALVKIDEMMGKYPGMVKQGVPSNPDRDPWHVALPYYVVSEAITSAMVAWGVYVLTRLTAPFLGKKSDSPDAPIHTKPHHTMRDEAPAMDIQTPDDKTKPSTKVDAASLQQAMMDPALSAQAAR